MASITCQDCATQRQGCPANTRYCKPCRLLRDLQYWRRRTRTCACSRKFAPISRNDFWCSKCDAGLDYATGPCRVALPDKPHDGPPAVYEIPVCAGCMRDPAMRARLIAALAHGQAARRKAPTPA